MNLLNKLDKTNIPSHVAVIMDGNGRWAKKKGNQRIFGHKNAIQAVRETVEAAGEAQVEFLTLYAFSTENWNRPKLEVDALMSLLISAVNDETQLLMKNNVRVKHIGNAQSLPSAVVIKLNELIEKTADNTGLTLILAISYSSRWEIIETVKKIAEKVKTGQLQPENINTEIFEQNLNTSQFPDPDLLIRTSGELRLSNFLMWQLSYAELYFTDILWPDFRKNDFFEALLHFQKRQRRYGKTEDQI